jgi:Ca2+-binding RTX toxin-like protein
MAVVQSLESRTLLAADTISLLGTAAADVINISQTGTVLTVKINAATKTYSTLGKTKLSVAAGDGDDTINLALSVKLNATLDGGNGKDKLHGGGGIDTFIGGPDTDFVDYSDSPVGVAVSLDGIANDGPTRTENVRTDVENVIGSAFADTIVGSAQPNVLVGNGGSDTLRGNAGRDVLIGGAGADTLDGGADDDLLVASRTTYDANVPSLRTLGFEWRNPANGYATRVSRLKAGVLGVKIDKNNVPTDLSPDGLTGGGATDWFVTHWGDTLRDKTAPETTTLLSSPIRWVSQRRYAELTTSAGDAGERKSKAAPGFATFTADLLSDVVGETEQDGSQWAYASVVHTSSLADSQIAYSGSTGAAGSHSLGNGWSTSYFSVTFVLDEPRPYTLTWNAAWGALDYRQFIGEFKLKLTKAGSSTPVFDMFATQPATNPGDAAGTKSGSLGPGQYTLISSTQSIGGGMPEVDMWADIGFTLKTTPAGG